MPSPGGSERGPGLWLSVVHVPSASRGWCDPAEPLVTICRYLVTDSPVPGGLSAGQATRSKEERDARHLDLKALTTIPTGSILRTSASGSHTFGSGFTNLALLQFQQRPAGICPEASSIRLLADTGRTRTLSGHRRSGPSSAYCRRAGRQDADAYRSIGPGYGGSSAGLMFSYKEQAAVPCPD